MNWGEFISLIFWALAGLIFHYLTKLNNAYRRKDFNTGVFVHRNWIPALVSFWAIIIVIALVSTNSYLSDKFDSFEAVFLGWSGSSFLKNLLKRHETKTNTSERT